MTAALRERCLQLGEHLDGYDKERFLSWSRLVMSWRTFFTVRAE